MIYQNLSLRFTLISFCLATLFISCWSIVKKPIEDPVYTQPVIHDEAYVPIYSKDSLASRSIIGMDPQPTILSGKIYVYGNLLFQVEKLMGIHVINYADRRNPVKIGFIRVRGCSELAVKGGYLITNNMSDLVTIDISKPGEVKEVARISNAFSAFYVAQFQNSLPPQSGRYYVCPDYNKGDISGWKLEKKVKGAYCYY